MYKRILVPTDGSKYADREINRARNLIDDDGEIIILSVAKKISAISFKNKFHVQQVNKQIKIKAEKDVKNMKNKFNSSLNIRTIVEVGSSPAETIIDISDENDVDLIVISSAGRGNISKFLIGSVASKVVDNAKMDVLLVH